jgi:hypothetical protein
MAEEEIEVEIHNEDGEHYVEYDLQIYPSDYTLKVITDMWEDRDIEIPEFQRNFVWTLKQSSLLIESFLVGLPVPQLFFYIDDKHKNLVIDGQQRITTIVDFFSGYFGPENTHGRRQVFRLTGLDEKSPFNKKRYVDLDEADQRKLRSTVLRVVNIRQLAPSGDTTSIYHIFERLNTGGTPLRPQEIRNCVYSGPIVAALKKLNLDSNWRKIIGRKAPEKHQRDVEMILRVFALSAYLTEYEKPMKTFLGRAMDRNKAAKSRPWLNFESRFPEVCRHLVETCGEKPFHVRGPINLAALDSVMATLLKTRRPIPEDLRERLDTLFGNDEFRETMFYNTSDTITVETRMKKAKEVLEG